MTLEAIYYFSQIVAVVAILASLIFVGSQVRPSVEQTKFANRLARADMSERAMRAFSEVHREAMANRDLADAFHKVQLALSGSDTKSATRGPADEQSHRRRRCPLACSAPSPFRATQFVD